ncbi:TolC family protein [Leeuwenhoekiella sp. A16]|uniref:TolC family protein n=1 Tax=unclassified Leeuwenhoekiella TaxID=2615029 RepID=UPI003A7F630C
MKNKFNSIKKVFTLIAIITFGCTYGQDTIPLQDTQFSLEEAIIYGLEHNYSANNARTDIAIALKQKWEIIAQGLPQISGAANYQNQLVQPVTFIPGVIAGGEAGTFIPVTFGTKQSLNAIATWDQLIFDGSYIVGVQSAKTLLKISENAKVKTDLELKEEIINAYGNVLLAEESVAILKKNLSSLQKNYEDTRKIFENGLAEEEDVEQLQITLIGLQSNLDNAVRMQSIASDMLKVTLGIPLDYNISVTDDLDELAMQYFDLSLLRKSISVEDNIDYRIAEDQANQAEILVKLEKSKSLPKLTAYLNYGVQGNSEKFTFFSDNQRYFDQSILGVNLSVPVFSSGMRNARTAQQELAYKQKLEDLEETRNRVKLQISSAQNDYQFSLDNYDNQKKNLALAERIENKNQIKFFEGIATSFELSEAQRQLYQAQQNYLQAMLDVITNKATLEKVLDTTEYQPKERN